MTGARTNCDVCGEAKISLPTFLQTISTNVMHIESQGSVNPLYFGVSLNVYDIMKEMCSYFHIYNHFHDDRYVVQ